MTRPTIPDRALVELGRTEGTPDTLALLVRDQDTRRLLLLRAVLDAAEAADPALCSPGRKARLREDWSLLAEADHPQPPGTHPPAGTPPDPRGTPPPGDPRGTPGPGAPHPSSGPAHPPAGTPQDPRGASHSSLGAPHPLPGTVHPHPPGAVLSPARDRLFHPLTGPWALSCLHGLDGRAGPPDGPRSRRLRQDLAHFSAIAAVAAARAGIPFTVRLTAYAGVLTLPSLGSLRTATRGDVPVDVTHRRGCLTVRRPDAPDVVVRLESGIGAWSGALAWTPVHALPGLPSAGGPMPLDDVDPYRVAPGPRHRTLGGPATLDDADVKRWLQAWSGTEAALRTGGAHRVTEAVALLRCLVPLERPPGAEGRDSCSATRHEAFGALLSSTPQDALALAETLVHELHHAKLAALGDLVTLHHADAEARYFAPWKTDPRPYDGLLQGIYSHLALADYFQRRALRTTPPDSEYAWSRHARYRAQVGAALPGLVGSPDLTRRGRRFVDEMTATYERMADHPAPRNHTARAQAYVKAARALWTQRHAAAVPRPKE
ncbi:aKG-HExxH-type peptide beta-hydroxylase [Streptomyces zaehneri]|uniref:aKG-HExxH-type peptide beta-hydroxylase n=1 Tax=Streptomyces zaehneri TaxID=3051180 RepID=UPI0028D0D63D|nr:HEXXH motif-containing putative peptide modification protein [Streptomyces sp. DSM 40713]